MWTVSVVASQLFNVDNDGLFQWDHCLWRSVPLLCYKFKRNSRKRYQHLWWFCTSYLIRTCRVAVESIWSRISLRSAAHDNLFGPWTTTSTYGPRSFTVSGSVSWNSLPLSFHNPSLLPGQFCRQLDIFCSVGPSGPVLSWLRTLWDIRATKFSNRPEQLVRWVAWLKVCVLCRFDRVFPFSDREKCCYDFTSSSKGVPKDFLAGNGLISNAFSSFSSYGRRVVWQYIMQNIGTIAQSNSKFV